MNKLDHALALAARGFKVFPIAPGKKAPPLLNGWPAKATSDAEEVRSLWAAMPDANIGIHCAGLIVVDVDVKKGGAESLQKLDMIHGFPDTYTVITPSGGRHLYFRYAPSVANGVDVLGPGLDIRSQGGYVVASGSETDGGTYRSDGESEIAEAPSWLVHRLERFVARAQPVAAPVADAADLTVEHAREWLRTAERSVKGQGGDQAAYRVACALRDRGVSEAQACELMRSEAWDHGCGWREGWLEAKPIRSAYRYAQNAPGGKALTENDFPESIPETGRTAPKKGAPAVRFLDAAQPRQTHGRLVKGLLQRRSHAVAYGPPGQGKTFVALDLAYHVAAGRPWMTRAVHAGVVMYLAYEGTGALWKRLAALRQQYGDADVPLYVQSADFNLREQAGRRDLGQVIHSLPVLPVLIVVDTLHRALKGGDENSAQDMGALNDAVGALIEHTDACVLLVHHSGKNKAAGARGSSALLGAIDTEIEIDERQITARKQRDIELGDPIGFELKPVYLGIVDEDGEELSSCVVAPGVAPPKERGAQMKPSTKRAWEVLNDMAPNNEPVERKAWAARCKELGGCGRSQFYDAFRWLEKAGKIVKDGEMVTRRME